MTTHIEKNHWIASDDPPQAIEQLLRLLETEPLDPKFEDYGDFATINPLTTFGEPLYPRGTVVFWGNFANISRVFEIASDDSEVCDRLFAAIKANKASAAYQAERRKLIEWREYWRDRSKQERLAYTRNKAYSNRTDD